MLDGLNNAAKQQPGFRPGTSGNPRGRPRGSRNKRTKALIEAAQLGGELPLDYMLRVMRDPSAAAKRRDEMAKAAAPYVHAKLSSIDHSPLQDERRVTGIEVTFVVPKRRPDDIDRPQALS